MQQRDTAVDKPAHPDTSETVCISALALIKMLRHSRSGVPLEVMGLLLGEFTDDYTINVLDVFAMPQSATGVSVEAVDPIFQTNMTELLKRVGRPETVVGWYHSHPGFGCWLSNVDVNTQLSFEQLAPRAVAIVVDPIQSVKGKVIIDAFRSINLMQSLSLAWGRKLAPTAEPRQTTSNLGHLVRASHVAQMRGLGLRYYSLAISFKTGSQSQRMLECANRKVWSSASCDKRYSDRNKENLKRIEELLKMVNLFTKDLSGSMALDRKGKELKSVGKLSPKRRLEELSQELLEECIVEQMRSMFNTGLFIDSSFLSL